MVVFEKGIASQGSSFGYAASLTPVLAPLRTNVQAMMVTRSGPVWAP